jgi:hypothetical protein
MKIEYVSNDGARFDSETGCLTHEQMVEFAKTVDAKRLLENVIWGVPTSLLDEDNQMYANSVQKMVIFLMKNRAAIFAFFQRQDQAHDRSVDEVRRKNG